MNTWINILAILLSPVIAVAIGQRLAERKASAQRADQLLITLMGARHDTGGHEFISSLNMIPVVFKDYPDIVQALRHYYDLKAAGVQDDESLNGLINLIEKICKRLRYKNIQRKDIENIFQSRPRVEQQSPGAQR